MGKVDQKETKREIGLPEAGFPKSMYFNRFRIEREDGFTLVQFGLITASGILDSYSCVFTKEVLLQNQRTLLEYLGRIGQPVDKNPPTWKGPTTDHKTEVADIFTMAFFGEMAEICLYLFSISSSARARNVGQATGEVASQPLALLRCSSETQKQFIVALYED